MAIVNTCPPFPNFISEPTNISVRRCSTVPYLSNKRPAAVASISCPHIDVDYLESELRARGVTFSGIGDSCVVRMELENGNSANLMLPTGLITSFKAQMWHGRTMELLHTSVSPSPTENAGAGALIQGGLSLSLGCRNPDDGVSWSPNAWALHQVNGNPQDSIEVELISRNEESHAQVIKHIITLGRDLLTSEILVSNSSTASLHLMGSVTCHLAVSTPDATYAVGLEGSDFFIRPPFVADFNIIPREFTKRSNQDPRKFWALNKLFSKSDARKWNVEDDAESLMRDVKEDLEGEEQDNYKHLTQKLSRIYTCAPRDFTIIDRGRRNSVTVRRNGFKELYMFSPGSEHEWYDKYSYICIGHAALLEPLILNAQSEWRGGLQLWNPNS
ncbi:protein NDH-DEPENDENT CYCLIC ELECTRON FLOW 5 [Sesamum alatum]|uniref:Protein NDH-DEPENDENT CYCLIC ELECTRON FLOW 5 n=1 Tax=Sesamum alatum TaxID=300844 RepID=A0AAE2C8P9_9LAMI|nr:protein NDH-DEPENDENT CYCLIC ELECTRON FLOW 5 [Sesamum alatum]